MDWIIDILFTFDLFLVSVLVLGIFVGYALVFGIVLDVAHNDQFFLD